MKLFWDASPHGGEGVTLATNQNYGDQKEFYKLKIQKI
jgi:hypothetical protein